MPIEELFRWWNAIYTLPLAFVLVFLALTSVVSLVGGGLSHVTHGSAEVDAELETGEALPDAPLSEAETGGLEAHHEVDGHHGEMGAHSPLEAALVALGAGEAPLVMVLQVLLLLWGLIGIGLHEAFRVAGPGALLWSLPATIVLSLLGTRAFAALFSRFLKPIETSVVRRDQIVGRMGTVVFPVTEEAGTVHVRDQFGTLHRLQARSPHGQLESGREIIVLGYDPARKLYEVDDASAFIDR